MNRLKIELSSERGKCERLEADLSFIIEGRTREVSEMNDIIASLECKLKTAEATNDSLRQLINIIISNSKPNEIPPSNVPAMGDTQCLPSLEEQINYDLIHDPDAQIIKGRTREVNEINVINASLECNPETTEATNDSLRELISIKIPNPKPNEISPSNSPTTSNPLLPSHVELTNYDPKHVSPVKTSHGDQHKKVDSNAKKSNSTNYENPFVLTKLSITDESNTEECFSLSNENAIVSSQTENSSLNLDLPIKDLIHAHSQEENTTSSSAVIMRNPTNWLNYLPFCEVPLPKHEKLSNFQSDKINPQLSDCCPLSTPPSEKIDVKKRGANKGKLSFPSRKNKTCTKKSERHHSDRSPFHRRPTNHAPVMYHPNSLPPYQIHQLRKLHIPSYQPHRLNISPPYLPPCPKELPPYYPSPPMRSREWLDYLDIVHQVTRIL